MLQQLFCTRSCVLVNDEHLFHQVPNLFVLDIIDEVELLRVALNVPDSLAVHVLAHEDLHLHQNLVAVLPVKKLFLNTHFVNNAAQRPNVRFLSELLETALRRAVVR